MNEVLWNDIQGGLLDSDPVIAANACARLQAEAKEEDEPRLLAMLHHHDFYVREAAAWPLAENSGPRVIRELLVAYQRGFDEGHDNDGFTAALLEIPALYPNTRAVLEELLCGAAGTQRSHILWLLTFCEQQ
jgi:hypothetical protein